MNRNCVLFLTYWYPNKNNKSFGIFTKRHAQSISLNNDIIVLSLNIVKGHSAYALKTEVFKDENQIETHQIYIESRFNKLIFVLLPLHYLVLKRYISKKLMKNSFTIVHSNVIFPCGITGHHLAKKLKCRHFITEHWTKIDKFFSVSLYRFAAKRALDDATALTCVSGQLANTVRKYTDNNNIQIIPNVIDENVFYYNPEILENKIFTFIAVAHWAQHKNPFYFLEALQALVNEKRLHDFKMVIIGAGEQVDLMKSKGYNFEIEYKGVMDAAEISIELNRSHIFLHGSDFETFSVIIAEALMCGLPCVVSPVGIALEAINESNGFVTDNTVLDWKEKILKCYNTQYDKKKISEQLKYKYDLKTVGRLFDNLYQKN